MRFHRSCVLGIAGVFLCAGLAAGQGTQNAALKYWQAFGLMPKLDKDQEAILGNWTKVPLDEKTRAVIDMSRASLMYLRRGARVNHCDWGLDYEDGVALLMPHVQNTRTLTRLACLRARSELEKGNQEAALEDVLAALALGRQGAKDGTFISLLVGYAIENDAVALLAPHIPRLKPKVLPDLRAGLTKLPPSPSPWNCVLLEKRVFPLSFKPAILETVGKDPDKARQAFRGFFNTPEEADDAYRKLGEPKPEKILKFLTEMDPIYDELYALRSVSWAEFPACYRAFMAKTRETNPLAEQVLPRMEKVLSAEMRAKVRWEMLLAAIAVAEGGPSRLKGFQDPAGAGPFQYEKLAGGFRLQSAFKDQDQPMALTFGTK